MNEQTPSLSDEQIQDLLRVGNPTDEECRLIRMGWDAAMRRQLVQASIKGWKLVPVDSTSEMDVAGSDHCDGYRSTAEAVWSAMIEVSPEFRND